jgi:2-oxo-4-hydroxy-4-carboxy-5-ureidoimidazoline decarboxylase
VTFEELNALSPEEAAAQLERCCGARRWVAGLLGLRPFTSRDALFLAADDVWSEMGREDWAEAFRHHPRIGDVEGLRKKFASTASWAAGEQAGAASADESTLEALARGNRVYEERFGCIFIVCATGKSAREMLDILEARLGHDIEHEWAVAAGEQHKITRLRLEKLLS